MQRPVTRNERLSHRGSVLCRSVLLLQGVGVAAPYRLARGCAKLSRSTVCHRRSLNIDIS